MLQPQCYQVANYCEWTDCLTEGVPFLATLLPGSQFCFSWCMSNWEPINFNVSYWTLTDRVIWLKHTNDLCYETTPSILHHALALTVSVLGRWKCSLLYFVIGWFNRDNEGQREEPNLTPSRVIAFWKVSWSGARRRACIHWLDPKSSVSLPIGHTVDECVSWKSTEPVPLTKWFFCWGPSFGSDDASQSRGIADSSPQTKLPHFPWLSSVCVCLCVCASVK